MSNPPSGEDPSTPMPVSDLIGHLKAVVEGTFPPLWIAGEISGLSRPRSGHLYFTLKDSEAEIRACMWRGVAERLKFQPEDGQAVLAFGGLEVYAKRGSTQLIVRRMQPAGAGALQMALEQLHTKLDKEGLFDSKRKRPLPMFPARIGVVTSETAAALHDFLEAARNRYRGISILLVPTIVQGERAAASIVRAIRQAEQITPPLDALVVTRGGGSLEDLWCFNEERVVRAIADCSIPTVSAIGHEIDVTLSDMAADVRALTPTDAANRILPDGQAIADAFHGWELRLSRSIQSMLDLQRSRLNALLDRPVLRNPHEVVHNQSRLLDDLDSRATEAILNGINAASSQLATAAASLAALSPIAVLSRGYSVTKKSDGSAILSAEEIEPGDRLLTRFADGEVGSTVNFSGTETGR